VIIHIGIEKTATTSLQSFLRRNDQELLKHGYFLPKSGGEFNQELFAKSFSRGPKNFLKRHGVFERSDQAKIREQLQRDIEDEINQLRTSPRAMIITSEWLHSKLTTAGEVNALGVFLQEFTQKTQVICYLKEQYSTSLKFGSSRSFEQHIRECSPGITYFNHFETLSRWSKFTNENDLRCRLFSKQDLDKGSIFTDFLNQLNIVHENDSWLKPSALNQSFSFKGALIFRALNETLAGSKIPWKHKQVLSEALAGSHNFVTEAEYNRISEAFSSSNEAVRKHFFPNREVLFEARKNFCETDLLEAELYPKFLSSVQAILARSENQFNEDVVQEICNLA
jgi:hypothetical protein